MKTISRCHFADGLASYLCPIHYHESLDGAQLIWSSCPCVCRSKERPIWHEPRTSTARSTISWPVPARNSALDSGDQVRLLSTSIIRDFSSWLAVFDALVCSVLVSFLPAHHIPSMALGFGNHLFFHARLISCIPICVPACMFVYCS